jgi:type I restriction enzyme S subunit
VSQLASTIGETSLAPFEDAPLPHGWRRVRLGDVCDIVARQVDPKLPQYGSLPHINGENILSGVCRLAYLNTASEESMTSGKYLFEAGDVLYSKLRPYLRKSVVAEVDGVCSADMYPIKVNHAVLDPHFAAWLLVSDEFTNYADNESRRARMPKLNRKQLFAWSAPLPPLSEQQRIVVKINESMAAVERARAAAEAQLKAAKDLPAAYLRDVFDNPEVKQWERKSFDEITTDRLIGLVRSSAEQNLSATYPYLKMDNITNDGHLRLQQVVRVAATSNEAARYCLRQGDFLFNTRNSFELVGKTAVFNIEEDDWLFNNNIMRVRFINGVSSEFILWAFHSKEVKSQLESIKSNTTSVCAIYDRQLATITIPVPSLVKQQQIAHALNNQMSVTNQIKQTIQDEIDAINKLPAALLRQAFTGKL